METTLDHLVHCARAMHTTHRMNQTYLSALTFENLAQYFKLPAVVESTRACIEACINACREWKVYEGPPIEVKTRYVLAGYMLAMHPNTAVHQDADAAGELLRSAATIIQQWEGMLDILVFGGPVANKREFFITLAQGFCENLADFHTKFNACKLTDEPAFASRTLRTLLSLFAAMLLTNGQGPLDTEEPAIRQYLLAIERLRARLLDMGYHGTVDAYDRMAGDILEERAQLLLLREEQARNQEAGFDFLEQA